MLFSLSAQIGEQVDFLRFLPPKSEHNKSQWWASLLLAGPGWIIVGGFKIFAGSFLAFVAVKMLVPLEVAVDPAHMYRVAFEFVFSTPGFVTLSAATFVILSQVKINVTNAYAGSIAWSNFFSRLTHSHPGRVVWLVFNVAIAMLLITLGIYRALEQILGLYSIIAVAWVGTLSADIMINKPLGLSPKYIEFRRAYLYDLNPVGVGSIILAIISAGVANSGLLGETLKALSSYVALGVAFSAAPLIAWYTQGRYYIAREPEVFDGGKSEACCCICETTFEVEDMAVCPVYDGPICSLCCSLDARCRDKCKVDSRYSDQMLWFIKAVLPSWITSRVNPSVGRYLGMQFVISAVIGGVLGLVFIQTNLSQWQNREVIQSVLLQVFLIMNIISGIATWLFVLARESTEVALEETSRQTYLLSEEVAAHKITDAKLQKAKEVAEAANSAKTRFVVSLNHEIRTPLNAVLGYSQIVERDPKTPGHQLDAIKVIRRSSEHLTELIDGLLNVSRIEAEHFTLDENEIWLNDFMLQFVQMFKLAATTKEIDFCYIKPEGLPLVISLDERRLSQILINLLSNALKFTNDGWVSLTVSYYEGSLNITVSDTGIGISESDKDRIFEPFERAGQPTGMSVEGTGLGLAIAKLLVERMGGAVTLESTLLQGSTFQVSLPAKVVTNPAVSPPKEPQITGYSGPTRSIIITDDDPIHCELLTEILKPLGFTLFTAKNADECLKLTKLNTPDLYLLDISMPGMNGLSLASVLRSEFKSLSKIVMISANAKEERPEGTPKPEHDGYLIKPVEYHAFMKMLQGVLDLEWVFQGDTGADGFNITLNIQPETIPPAEHIDELKRLGRMGHVRGIQSKLSEIEQKFPDFQPVSAELRLCIHEFRLLSFTALLQEIEVSRGKILQY